MNIRAIYSQLSLRSQIIIPFLSVCLGLWMIGTIGLGYLFTQRLKNETVEEIKEDRLNILRKFETEMRFLSLQGRLLVENQETLRLVQQRNDSDLLQILLPLRFTLKLDLVKVIAPNGDALISLQDSQINPKNLLSPSMMERVLKGVYFSGLLTPENSPPLLVSVAPFKDEDNFMGAVLLGIKLNDRFLQQIQSDPHDGVIAFLDGQLVATTLPAALDRSWQPPTPEAVPQRIDIGLDNYLATTITVPQINHPSFQLVLLESLVTLQKTEQRGWILIGTFAIVGGAIATTAGTVVTRFISDRIHILTDQTQELATGHLSKTITMDGNDEITTLARGFNYMSEQLQSRDDKLTLQMQELENTLKKLQQTQTQLIQTEKMSGLGQMVAGVAHEINNPLSFIYGNVTYAKEYITDLLGLVNLYQQKYPNPDPEIDAEIEAIELDFLVEDLPQLLDSMQDGADRIRQIVLSLRNFSRMDEAEMKQVDIHQGIDSTLVILRNRLTENSSTQIEVIKNYGKLPLVECYASQVNQVFMNILVNAIDALNALETVEADHQPKITISTDIKLRESQGRNKDDRDDAPEKSIQDEKSAVVIKIADNGPGMPDRVKERIFDPFFTTKPVGKGTGLGLSISYQIIVEKHHGILQCFSNPGEGTTFLIEIPIGHRATKTIQD